MKHLIALSLSLAFQLITSQISYAQVQAPTILSAKFDSEGKLVVRSEQSAIAGCYVAINGGLSKKSVETGITSIQLTEAQAARGTVNIRTKRRYYCKQRTLYVTAELVCLNSVIGSATSAAKAVSVPSSNLKR